MWCRCMCLDLVRVHVMNTPVLGTMQTITTHTNRQRQRIPLQNTKYQIPNILVTQVKPATSC